jgi:integrase
MGAVAKHGPGPVGTVKAKGKWWARWTCTLKHEHRRVAESHKAARHAYHAEKAKVAEAKRRGEICCPKFTAKWTPRTVDDLLADFLAYSKEKKRSYGHDVARARLLRDRLGDRLATDVTPKDVETMQREMTTAIRDGGMGWTPATANQYCKLLKAVYNRARKHGLPITNPVAAVTFYKEHNAPNRCLSVEEQDRLLASLPEWLRPLLLVAIHTGLRKSELLRLHWVNVNFDTGSIHIPLDKPGEGKWVAMNSVAREALLTIKRTRRVMSKWVFCSPHGGYLHNFERYWRPALKEAQVPDFRFHDSRHTFASRLVMEAVDLYTVQRAGGWKTQAMVQRYAHLSPDHMRAAVERLAKAPSRAESVTKSVTGASSAQAGRHVGT